MSQPAAAAATAIPLAKETKRNYIVAKSQTDKKRKATFHFKGVIIGWLDDLIIIRTTYFECVAIKNGMREYLIVVELTISSVSLFISQNGNPGDSCVFRCIPEDSRCGHKF